MIVGLQPGGPAPLTDDVHQIVLSAISARDVQACQTSLLILHREGVANYEAFFVVVQLDGFC